jgi:hypothetical protein
MLEKVAFIVSAQMRGSAAARPIAKIKRRNCILDRLENGMKWEMNAFIMI